jgi:hypothetical protein
MSKAGKPESTPPSKPNKPKQSEATGRRPRDGQLDVPAMIEDFFQSHIVVKEQGTSRRMSCFEAILHQLWQRHMAGSRKASRLFARYVNFAASRGGADEIEVRVVPDKSDIGVKSKERNQ